MWALITLSYFIPDDNSLEFQSKINFTIHTNEEFRLKLNAINSESKSNKWEFIGIDDHLKTSVMAGLIENYNGASKYLKHKTSSSQVTRMLVLRLISRKELLQLENFIDYEVVKSQVIDSSTHIVAGVTYGTEVYCVLTHDLDRELDEEEAREVANENLHDLTTILINALRNNQDYNYFHNQFNEEEKRQMVRTNCRVYTNHQIQAVKECNFFDAYRHCLHVIEQVQTTNCEENQAIPISVFLCPLNHIFGSIKETGKLFQYRDVDANVVTRCCRIWVGLERARAEAEAIQTDNSKRSLLQFVDAIHKFQNLLKESLKFAVAKARETDESDDNEVSRIVDIVETLSFFKPAGLKRWLDCKKAELKMADKIKKTKGITFFVSKMELINNKLKSSPDEKYALVMWIPALDGMTNKIANEMTSYVENKTKLVPASFGKSTEDEGALPWYMDDRERKMINENIRKFVDYVTKIETTGISKVYFFIASDESGNKFGCHYSVYRDDSVLKENLKQLPGPPTNVTIKPVVHSEKCVNVKRSPTVWVSWNYDDLGYACLFFIEYREKGDDESWYQQKTTEMGKRKFELPINIQPGVLMEVRVAADTCIGRSEYSEIVEAESPPFIDDDDDVFHDFENSSHTSSYRSLENKSHSEIFAYG